MPMQDAERSRRFAAAILPLLPVAYHAARWLTASSADAEDVVQEAFLRGLRYFDGFRGGDARTWLLRIVRNCARDLHQAQPPTAETLDAALERTVSEVPGPETEAEKDSSARMIRAAVAALPEEYREVLVLREFEGLSYRAIAEIVEAPMGTVMSRLSRARDRLAAAVRGEA